MKKTIALLVCLFSYANLHAQTLIAHYSMDTVINTGTQLIIPNIVNPGGSTDGSIQVISGNSSHIISDSGHTCFNFDGKKQINLNWNPLTIDTTFIITMWVKAYGSNIDPTSFIYGAPLISFGNSTNNTSESAFDIGIDSLNTGKGRLAFETRDFNHTLSAICYSPIMGQQISSKFNVSNGTWKFIAIRHDSIGFLNSYYQFFVDTNMLPKSYTIDKGYISHPQTINNMRFGNVLVGGIGNIGVFLNGYMDDVRIYYGTGSFSSDSLLLDSLARIQYNSTQTGISTIFNKKLVLPYPNPSSDKVIFSDNVVYSQINIYDYSGKLIKTEFNSNTIEILDMNPGIYFAKLYYKNELHESKFVKE